MKIYEHLKNDFVKQKPFFYAYVMWLAFNTLILLIFREALKYAYLLDKNFEYELYFNEVFTSSFEFSYIGPIEAFTASIITLLHNHLLQPYVFGKVTKIYKQYESMLSKIFYITAVFYTFLICFCASIVLHLNSALFFADEKSFFHSLLHLMWILAIFILPFRSLIKIIEEY